jgi:hypothetical protein
MIKRIDSFSVSQSSYDCYRKIYFEMVNPKEANNNSIGRFALGDIVDTIMKGVFEGLGARTDVICKKRYFDDKFEITGSPDAKFDNLVVEVKSVGLYAWKYIAGGSTKGEVIIGKPKVQHVRQLNTYMGIEGIKDGVLIYVNKDDFSIKPYSIVYSNDLMIHTAAGCVTVYRAIMENRIPDKIKSDECLYCNYKTECKVI